MEFTEIYEVLQQVEQGERPFLTGRDGERRVRYEVSFTPSHPDTEIGGLSLNYQRTPPYDAELEARGWVKTDGETVTHQGSPELLRLLAQTALSELQNSQLAGPTTHTEPPLQRRAQEFLETIINELAPERVR